MTTAGSVQEDSLLSAGESEEFMCSDNHGKDLCRFRIYWRDGDVDAEIAGLSVVHVGAQKPNVGFPGFSVNDGTAEEVAGRITMLDENFVCEAKFGKVSFTQVRRRIWSNERLNESYMRVPVPPGTKNDDMSA